MGWKITIRNETTIQFYYIFVIPFQECSPLQECIPFQECIPLQEYIPFKECIPLQECIPRMNYIFSILKILNYILEIFLEIHCYSYLLFQMECF
jgi:hypothetical protein